MTKIYRTTLSEIKKLIREQKLSKQEIMVIDIMIDIEDKVNELAKLASLKGDAGELADDVAEKIRKVILDSWVGEEMAQRRTHKRGV